MDKEKELVKVKFNKERGFFEAFMPDGTKIPHQLEIYLQDTIDGSLMYAEIKVLVNFELF